MRIDPHQPEALIGLSHSLSVEVNSFLSANPAEDAERADALASQALPAHPDNAIAHLAKARSSYALKQYDAGIAEAEAAIADDRNLATPTTIIGRKSLAPPDMTTPAARLPSQNARTERVRLSQQ